MNKKASISTTMTWIVATLIIISLSAAFILGTLIISTKQKYSSQAGSIFIEENRADSDFALQKSFENFLNRKIISNGEELAISEVLEGEISEETTTSIKENADKIFSELLPYPMEGYSGLNPWWFRVYKTGEAMNSNGLSNKFHVGGHNCNPNNKDESLIISYLTQNKRAILCIDREYYLAWRSNKHV